MLSGNFLGAASRTCWPATESGGERSAVYFTNAIDTRTGVAVVLNTHRVRPGRAPALHRRVQQNRTIVTRWTDAAAACCLSSALFDRVQRNLIQRSAADTSA